MFKKKYLMLNFSHPFGTETEKQYRIVSFPLQIPVDIAGSRNPNELETFVREFCLKCINSDPEISGLVQVGKFVVALPGHSQAAAIILAVLHGVSGHFPKTIYQVRVNDGFEPIDGKMDLQTTRDTSRLNRDFGRAVQASRAVKENLYRY